MRSSAVTTVRLAFVGDVALGGSFVSEACPPGSPLVYPFATVNPLLRECDALVLNLEGPLGISGNPRPDVTARMYNDDAVLDWFRAVGCCICNLANNHMLDYGPEAFLRTVNRLNVEGVPHVGAGNNAEDAAQPTFVTINHRVIGFLGYTTNERHVGSVLATESSPGCAGLPSEGKILAKVEEVAARCDSLVVSLHWGHEFHRYPVPEHVCLARRLVDHGACVVAAHHPHVQQAVEEYRGGLIAYSLGNFFLPEFRLPRGRLLYRKPYTRQFALLRAELAGRRVSHWEVNGGRWDRHYRLIPYSGVQAAKFQREMEFLAAPLRGDDYSSFWRRYAVIRHKELRRERYRDMVGKLWLADWGELLVGATARNVTSSFRRVMGRFGFKQSV